VFTQVHREPMPCNLLRGCIEVAQGALMAKAWTDKYIQNLRPTDKKYYDREGRGFTIRVMPSGVKTFLYVYTINGKRQELNLGNYPHTKLSDARNEYSAAYTLVSKDIDPKEHNKAIKEAQDNKENITFKYFADLYLEFSKQHHVDSWHKTNRLSLNNDVLPFWSSRDITSISKRDCIELLERVAQRSKGQVCNVHKAARGVFEYALQRERIEFNPMIKLSKVVPALKETHRDRVLTEQEIRHVWQTLDNTPTSRAIKLILVTAQRPGEVAGLHRNEIAGDTWALPKERAEKGRGEHITHLTETALGLIGDTTDMVFDVKRNSLSQVVSRAKYYGLPRWTPHDLRRTARTLMAKIGIIDEHAEAVLAHCKQGIKKVYNKYEYQEEKKTALLKWETELLRILEQPTIDTKSVTAPIAELINSESPHTTRDPLADFTPPAPLADADLIFFKSPIISFESCHAIIDPLALIEIEVESDKS